MTDTATFTMSIGEIVAADYRAAAVFQRHRIDFCCQGARTLDRGCREAGADTTEVIREIEAATAAAATAVPRFSEWALQGLAAYIVANHHAFVREMLPLMIAHSRKIAGVHGNRHPELPRVAALVQDLADDMTSHMKKEEQILFP